MNCCEAPNIERDSLAKPPMVDTNAVKGALENRSSHGISSLETCSMCIYTIHLARSRPDTNDVPLVRERVQERYLWVFAQAITDRGVHCAHLSGVPTTGTIRNTSAVCTMYHE
jgi:hypothetical protein